MCEKISPYAQEVIAQLQAAMNSGDLTSFSDLIFDAECEGLETQIDLQWYEKVAARMTEEHQA